MVRNYMDMGITFIVFLAIAGYFDIELSVVCYLVAEVDLGMRNTVIT
jgi:hypothetical protein